MHSPLPPSLRLLLLATGLGSAACSDYEYSNVRGSDVFWQGGEEAAADVLFGRIGDAIDARIRRAADIDSPFENGVGFLRATS